MKRRDFLIGSGVFLGLNTLHTSSFAKEGLSQDNQKDSLSQFIPTEDAESLFQTGRDTDVLRFLRHIPKYKHPLLYAPSEREKIFSKYSVGVDGSLGSAPVLPLTMLESTLPYQGVRIREGACTSTLAAGVSRHTEIVKNARTQGIGATVLKLNSLQGNENVPILELTQSTNAELDMVRGVVVFSAYPDKESIAGGVRQPAYLPGYSIDLRGRESLQKMISRAIHWHGEGIDPLVKRGMMFVPCADKKSLTLALLVTPQAYGGLVLDSNATFSGVVVTSVGISDSDNNQKLVFLLAGPDTIRYAPTA